jgi:hypothetical protein
MQEATINTAAVLNDRIQSEEVAHVCSVAAYGSLTATIIYQAGSGYKKEEEILLEVMLATCYNK